MRKTVLVLVGCLVFVAGPAFGGVGFGLFGTYGETNQYNRSFGAGLRVSFGGERLMGDFTATWFPSRNGVVVKEGSFQINDSLQILPLELGLRWMFSPDSSLRPYLGIGGTYMLINLGTGNADASEVMGPKYDTPTLLGVYRTAPYLHHGKAETLKDVLTKFNPDDKHGSSSHLTVEELDDLVEFLKALPYEDPVPAATAAGLKKVVK